MEKQRLGVNLLSNRSLPSAPSPAEFFIFDPESADFWWTSSGFLPLTFYSFNRTSFNFHFLGTSNPRRFVDLQTEEFWSIP